MSLITNKVKQHIKGIGRKSSSLAYSLLAGLFIAKQSAAATYTLPSPVTSLSDGDYISLLRKGFSDFAVLASETFGITSLIIMAAIFIIQFVQVQNQKQTWGGLAMTMGIGAAILVIVYIILDQATSLSGTGLSS